MSRTYAPWGASAPAAANALEAPVDEVRTIVGPEFGARPSGLMAVPPPGKGLPPGLSHARRERRLVVSEHAAPIGVEQYRRLAASLHELQADRGLKTLMVTSTVPGEGKTLTIVNLALTLSQTYRQRVLLIDADLRRPAVHEWFGLPNTAGLAEMLSSDIMAPCKTRMPRSSLWSVLISEHLSVIPAGQSSQSMADLTTDRVATFLDESAKAFDWVLLDAPPIGIMPEAQLLARLTRAVLFVIAANATPYPLVRRAVDGLAPEWIVGTVLNRVEEPCIPAADYYRAYYSQGTEGRTGSAR